MHGMQSKSPDQSKKKTKKRRILLVEDHPTFRTGMALLINAEEDLEVCGEAETANAALMAVDQLRPDLALVDISLKESNGLELIQQIKSKSPQLPCLVLSMHEETLYAKRAMQVGASGYVMKHKAACEVMLAIRAVLNGKRYFGPLFYPSNCLDD